MWFNKKSGRITEDKGWDAMRELLDKELPQKKKKTRLVLWLWPVFLGLGLGFYFSATNGEIKKQTPKNQRISDSSPSEAVVGIHTKDLFVNPTSDPTKGPVSKNTLKTKTENQAVIPSQRVKPALENRMVNQSATHHPAPATNAENSLTTEIDETIAAVKTHSFSPMEISNPEEQGSSTIDNQKNRINRETNLLAEAPLQPIYAHRLDQMPEILVVNKKSKKSASLFPYVSLAGLVSHDTKDKGYSLGAGLCWQANNRLTLTAGGQYENFRGKYGYPTKSPLQDIKSNDFIAITNVRQWSVPVLLHFDVIRKKLSIQGGLVSNYIRKTNEYYALPALTDAEITVGGLENNLTLASEAASEIPSHYYEWQAGISYRFLKTFSGTVYYRRQFEKENPGIVPSTGLYGLQLTYFIR